MPENDKIDNQPEPEPKYDETQYARLKACFEKGDEDIKEWNKYRADHPDEDIHLEGADLSHFHLKGAWLHTGPTYDVSPVVYLRGKVYLQGTDLSCANLQEAYLSYAKLQGAKLIDADLQGARLQKAKLQGAQLQVANLQGAKFINANLQGARLLEADLQGADLATAKLQSADFSRIIVDGRTLIWRCEIDKKTKFEGVGLGNVRIYPEEKQLLEYNIRRMNWHNRYRDAQWPTKRFSLVNIIIKKLVQAFWAMSDYGISTWGVVRCFLCLSIIFACVYYTWGLFDYNIIPETDHPGIVKYLFVLEDTQESVPRLLVPFRAVYFSIVTMTTLGFGDMYANAHTFWRGLFGHLLLSLQVILGYVLLGALVTRFAVLFQAGGPAGEFKELTKQEKQELEDIKKTK